VWAAWTQTRFSDLKFSKNQPCYSITKNIFYRKINQSEQIKICARMQILNCILQKPFISIYKCEMKCKISVTEEDAIENWILSLFLVMKVGASGCAHIKIMRLAKALSIIKSRLCAADFLQVRRPARLSPRAAPL